MTRKPKPAAPGSAPDIESMIRVDHAGEYGAVRIYQGQLAVLRRKKGTERSVETIEHMAEQEKHHLQAFDKLVNERKVRPTALEPIWRVANMARGKYLGDLGNTPGHVNHWSKRSFVSMLARHGKVEEVRSPFPWTMVLVRVS